MAKAKPTDHPTHVAPESAPFQTAAEPTPAVVVKECCANCRGAVTKAGLIFCHGRPPTAVYRQMVIGIGSVGDPVWPKMSPDDWCMAWEARLH